MESRAFHICPFCHAASPVSQTRCPSCTRSLVGLPLAVYGTELATAVARPAPEPLADLPLRMAPFAANGDASTVMTRPAREPAVGAIVVMAAALIGSIAVGSALVRPRRPPSPRRTAQIDTVHPDVRALPVAMRADPADVRLAREPIARNARATSDEVREPGEDTPILRAQLSRAEESRDRLAERVGRLRARTNVSVITDVDRYQRLQDELETAREDLDRAEADVARWRRALRRVG
jgi:hypothetical protein